MVVHRYLMHIIFVLPLRLLQSDLKFRKRENELSESRMDGWL